MDARNSVFAAGARAVALTIVFAGIVVAALPSLSAEESASPASASNETALHAEIDRLLNEGYKARQIEPAGPADDAEFLRRAYLDLNGTIPTAEATREFLDDNASDKRTQLVERLLASDYYPQHMQRVFDMYLMERRPSKSVKLGLWQEYLQESFAKNKPWDQLCREILAADGADEKWRPAARFFLDRDGEPNLLTRDVGRLLLGVDMQCAQCHDHPLIDDYLQADYYGLFAFFNRTFLFPGKTRRPTDAVLAEKAEGDVTFKSVFIADSNGATGPHLPGEKAIDEPKFEKGQEYAVKAAKDVRPVPKYSRRAKLVELLPRPETRAFGRNLVNRLWAHMFGRGLVHPLDFHHSANPPSHPELLELLTDRFVASKYDIKALLRELALTDAYQRSSESPGDVRPPPESFAVAPLKGLSAEQLAESMLQATGVTDVERAVFGSKASAEALAKKLTPHVESFVSTFGGPAGEPVGDFQAPLDQILFLVNGATVQGWLKPQGGNNGQGGNLMNRLEKLSDAEQVADELYLSVLTRRPGQEERVEAVEHLRQGGQDRTAALRELIWALLASSEFRFNH